LTDHVGRVKLMTLGGYLYSANPTFPWIFVTIATVISVLISALFLRDPKHAQV
jgi:hypothetical protein